MTFERWLIVLLISCGTLTYIVHLILDHLAKENEKERIRFVENEKERARVNSWNAAWTVIENMMQRHHEKELAEIANAAKIRPGETTE